MAATRSLLRLLSSKTIRTGLRSENTIPLWPRIAYQYTKAARPLYTYAEQPWMKYCSRFCGQTQQYTCHALLHPFTTRTLSTVVGRPLLSAPSGNLGFRRGITLVSKKGKRKTCKAVAKRFIRTGKGKLKRWRCGYHHNQTKKSSRRKRFLRKPTYVSKTQLKTLNKMLNGW